MYNLKKRLVKWLLRSMKENLSFIVDYSPRNNAIAHLLEDLEKL
jgi:hypothetical protein